MAGLISSRINVIENREHSSNSTRLQQIKSKLMEQVYLDDNPITALVDYNTDILHLLDCEGAVILYNKKMQTKGNVPERYEIKDLVMWLQNQQIDKTYAVNNLLSVYDNAAAFSKIASGIIVLPIHANNGEYIIGFRPEVVQNVNWGGNPNEAIKFEKNKINYHPRNSFKLWRQTLEGTSLPWQKDHLEVAESFRNFLIEYTLHKVYASL
jgi:light-regulated signal transduction histidine kinase (bacteriophytochrome)